MLGAQTQFLAFAIGLAFVAAGSRVFTARGAGARRDEPEHGDTDLAYVEFRDLAVAIGLVVGGGLLYSLYIAKVGLAPLLDRSNFAEKYRVSGGLGALYGGLNVMILGCLWAEAGRLSIRARRIFRGVAGAIALWAIAVVAVRTYAVALFLGYLYLYCRRRRFSVASVKPALVVALALGYVGVEAIALARSVWEGDVTTALAAVAEEGSQVERTLGQIVGGSEFSHPFLTQMELLRYEEEGALDGGSYVGALIGLAPLSLVPNRPPSVAQEFARSHYPEFAARGGGTAFSYVGEAWWNFGGLVGPLLVGAFTAWLLQGLARSAALAPYGLIARFLPYGIHLVLLLHRNSFSSLAKQLFLVALPTLLILAAAQLVWHAVGERRSATLPQEAS